MKTFETDLHIEASPAKVWAVLMDFAAYPDWNPFVRRIEGEARVGARLEVFIQPPGGKGMTFQPTVLRCEAEREFRWLGHLGIPGLFDGEHYFLLQPAPDRGTTLVHGEHFRGILLPLLAGALKKSLVGFERMNLALKARCECH